MIYMLTNQVEIQVISVNSMRHFRSLESEKAPYIQIPKETETLTGNSGHMKRSFQGSPLREEASGRMPEDFTGLPPTWLSKREHPHCMAESARFLVQVPFCNLPGVLPWH